ncbi:hypothetical protein [Streptomyces sp. NBC_00299]|uniref:hypothetical protein n=1 Tax=Streptomyces sp. NBC_00299 TaxID=2975705 RepID=UPI002E2E7593|nr:hypothetical protein [Streptomyces sp. NBC_00299]
MHLLGVGDQGRAVVEEGSEQSPHLRIPLLLAQVVALVEGPVVGVAQAVGDRVPLGKDPLAGSYRRGDLFNAGLMYGPLVAGKQPVGHRGRRAHRVRVDDDAVGRVHPARAIAAARLQGGDQKLTFAPRAVDDDQLATGVAGENGVPGQHELIEGPVHMPEVPDPLRERELIGVRGVLLGDDGP